MMLNRTSTALFSIAVVPGAVAVGLVAMGEGRLPTLLLNLSAVGLVAAAILLTKSRSEQTHRQPWIERADIPLLAAIMLVQFLGLLYMQTFTFHYVQDEFITGYTSYTLASLTEIEWFAGYPGPGEWIAGFPILYYALQWPFIELLGLSLETIRISTWPYHLLTAALVYLIGKEFFRCRPWAVVASLTYILLAPNLYMAGYGMHNISSTFFFVAAVYASIRMIRDDSRSWVVVCGVFATMAYLTYTSSYLTLPIILVLAGLFALFKRTWQPLLRFGQVLLIVAVGLSPFLTYALTEHNYFTQRGDQVNAISAIWGSDEVERPSSELVAHVWRNIQSLYSPGIGGVTDYWFGHQSLFDWFTLILLVAGLGIASVRGIQRRDPLHLTAVIGVLSTFVLGMLLTLPAGGFHRTTLAFPFVAMLIALTLRTAIESVPWPWLTKRPRLQISTTALLLGAFILLNVSTLQSMARHDEQISGLTDSVPISQYFEHSVHDNQTVIISAFPNYHLERELIVRSGDRYDVHIKPFNEAIDLAGDTIVVLFRPQQDQPHRLEARHGSGEFIDEWNGYQLRRHLIWVPPADD
jgi:hypothetical protein